MEQGKFGERPAVPEAGALPPPPPATQGGGPGAGPTGTPAPQVVYQVVQAQPANGMAVAGLVLGILGVLIPFLGILGLIFGAVGLSKANQGASGKGMAIAGVVLGIVGTLVTIAVLASSS
ncbi:MAG TPA: DUF4190 domain-containing protein [Actinomycetota bacterium]|nr:DUF4190 domain-containing protein [Actinomycetota bacterium]